MTASHSLYFNNLVVTTIVLLDVLISVLDSKEFSFHTIAQWNAWLTWDTQIMRTHKRLTANFGIEI